MTELSTLIPAYVNGVLTPVDKLAVHRAGLRHLAVSVFVTGPGGVLLQRRAMGKYHTPGLWTNTCCTHPYWGEPAMDCALRRLDQEMGLNGAALTHAGQVEYRADVGSGMTEHEVVDIFTGTAPTGMTITPDPAEVMAVDWVPLADLMARITAHPDQFTPWLRIYLTDHAATIFGA